MYGQKGAEGVVNSTTHSEDWDFNAYVNGKASPASSSSSSMSGRGEMVSGKPKGTSTGAVYQGGSAATESAAEIIGQVHSTTTDAHGPIEHVKSHFNMNSGLDTAGNASGTTIYAINETSYSNAMGSFSAEEGASAGVRQSTRKYGTKADIGYSTTTDSAVANSLGVASWDSKTFYGGSVTILGSGKISGNDTSNSARTIFGYYGTDSNYFSNRIESVVDASSGEFRLNISSFELKAIGGTSTYVEFRVSLYLDDDGPGSGGAVLLPDSYYANVTVNSLGVPVLTKTSGAGGSVNTSTGVASLSSYGLMPDLSGASSSAEVIFKVEVSGQAIVPNSGSLATTSEIAVGRPASPGVSAVPISLGLG